MSSGQSSVVNRISNRLLAKAAQLQRTALLSATDKAFAYVVADLRQLVEHKRARRAGMLGRDGLAA